MYHNSKSEKHVALLLVAALFGAMLIAAPFGARAATANAPGGKVVTVVNSSPGTVFSVNASRINGTLQYNFVGTGGNDTFIFIGGNASTTYTGTGLFNNSFILNSTGGGNSTFSLTSGNNSTFRIVEGNVNGSLSTQSFAITGGTRCSLNESSHGPVSNALWSVNLGANSTVSMSSQFVGNETAINIVF